MSVPVTCRTHQMIDFVLPRGCPEAVRTLLLIWSAGRDTDAVLALSRCHPEPSQFSWKATMGPSLLCAPKHNRRPLSCTTTMASAFVPSGAIHKHVQPSRD